MIVVVQVASGDVEHGGEDLLVEPSQMDFSSGRVNCVLTIRRALRAPCCCTTGVLDGPGLQLGEIEGAALHVPACRPVRPLSFGAFDLGASGSVDREMGFCWMPVAIEHEAGAVMQHPSSGMPSLHRETGS